MDRLILWLSKHLAAQVWRNIFTFESRCKQKPGCRFWTNRSDRSIQLVWPPRLLDTPIRLWKMMQSLKPKIGIWRDPIISYLKDPGHGVERNIRCIELKYVLIDSELYLWTVEYLFLKCLDSDQARVVIRKDHEGIGVYGNQFPRWSDCLEEPIFCPTMMSDYFK